MEDNTSSGFLGEAPGILQWFNFLHNEEGFDRPRLMMISQELIAMKTRRVAEAPLYLRALSAVGAIISGFLLLYLLWLFGLFDLSKISLTINGLLFCVLSAFLYRLGSHDGRRLQDFYIQLALTFLQVGKFALVAGLVQIGHDLFALSWFWTISVILGLVAILSFLAFPSSIERFFSAIAFLLSLWVSLLADCPRELQLIGFDVLLAAHLFALAAFLVWPVVRQTLTSLYGALLISLCLAVGVISSLVHIDRTSWVDMPDQFAGIFGFGYKWSVLVALALALAALILWVAGQRKRRFNEPLVVSLVGVFCLALLSDPGILLALGLMILGYATHRPAQILLGLAFALLFGFFYYYMLELSLMQKSMVLIASGLLLLFGAGYIYRRGWHRPPREATELRRSDMSKRGGHA